MKQLCAAPMTILRKAAMQQSTPRILQESEALLPLHFLAGHLKAVIISNLLHSYDLALYR